jgi:hypothetical protein
MNTNIRTEVHNTKDGSIITFTDSRNVKHNQKDTTNGAKRVRIESYKDMALNSVVKLIESNEFKEKRRIERQERREFFKAKRMK